MEKYVIEIVSPLQILLSLEMVRTLAREAEIHVIVIGGFNGAEAVARKLRPMMSDAKSIKYFPTFRRSMRFTSIISPDRIFTHADVGVQKGLQLLWLKARNPAMKISVYEEGLGTYRDDLYRGLKRLLFPFIGIGTHFGGFSLTSEVHVLSPDMYRRKFPRSRKKIVQIPRSPMETIANNKKNIYGLFNYNEVPKSDGRCVVYMSSWEVDKAFFSEIATGKCDTYFKAHPRLDFIPSQTNIINIPANIPAEILLADLSQKYRDVTVYHHGTSAVRYCSGWGIKFIGVSTST